MLFWKIVILRVRQFVRKKLFKNILQSKSQHFLNEFENWSRWHHYDHVMNLAWISSAIQFDNWLDRISSSKTMIDVRSSSKVNWKTGRNFSDILKFVLREICVCEYWIPAHSLTRLNWLFVNVYLSHVFSSAHSYRKVIILRDIDEEMLTDIYELLQEEDSREENSYMTVHK